MKFSSQYLDNAVRQLSRLPGIGSKSALRLAFHLIALSERDMQELTESMRNLKDHVSQCEECGGISDGTRCAVCSDSGRDRSRICVVEDARDMLIIEETGSFHGVYHILGGLLSPLDGVGPEQLRIAELETRLTRCDAACELILAFNPTVEGDATGLYLSRYFAGRNVTFSRLAHGLPMGADIEFADSVTIAKSIEGRTPFSG